VASAAVAGLGESSGLASWRLCSVLQPARQSAARGGGNIRRATAKICTIGGAMAAWLHQA